MIDSHHDLSELYDGSRRLTRMQEDLRELEVDVSSPDGSVNVAVDAFGKVLRVRINTEEGKRDDRQLGQTLLAALQAAQGAAMQAVEETMRQTFPNIPAEVFHPADPR